MGLTEKKLDKISLSTANILTAEIGVLEERVNWLTDNLNLNENDIVKIVQKQPYILSFRSDINLDPKLDYLQNRLHLDKKSLQKMIMSYPSVLCRGTEENIEPKLDWLQQRLDLDDASLSKMIQLMPSLLSLNVDTNIEPTINFYVGVLGEGEALAFLQQDPIMITYSLEKRLKPRIEQARDAGMIIDTKCLQQIGKLTNDKWQKSLAAQVKKMVNN